MKRKLYIDVIRIVACFAVVFLHVAAQNFYTLKYNTFEWQVFNIYDAMVRFAVPLLFMISGALFLDDKKELNIKKLYKKNILRLFTAYWFWSFFYAIFNFLIIKQNSFNLKIIIKMTIDSSYHLWFVPVMISVYLLLPFLKKTFNKKNINLIKYFLILFFLFGIIKITLQRLFLIDYFNKMLNIFKPELIAGWIGYFVLGYYLNNKIISKNKIKVIYLSGFIALLTSIFTNVYYANLLNKNTTVLYNEFTIVNFLIVTAIFLFIKNRKGIFFEKHQNSIIKISSLTFGIYLVHIFVLNTLKTFGINTLIFNPIFSVVFISVLTFGISFAIVYLLSKIPVLKKYII